MKLADIIRVAVAGNFLAADKKPQELQAAILAEDKKAKDAAGSGLGSRNLEETDQPGAQDADMDERERACDERESACDEREEAMDSDKDDKEAKDRKGARDSRKGARDSRKGARDKRAKDRNDDPEGTNDEDYLQGSDPSTPGGNRSGGTTAIDSAEADRRIKIAIAARDALHEARSEVEPIIGKSAFDSAGATYEAALKRLGVDTVGVHASAFPSMLKLAKDRAAAQSPSSAMDSAAAVEFAKLIPGYGRLR